MTDGRRDDDYPPPPSGDGRDDRRDCAAGDDDDDDNGDEDDRHIGFYELEEQPEIRDGDDIRDEQILDADDLLGDDMMKFVLPYYLF